MARAVASSETNSVLEVPYPLDLEEPLLPALLEVRARCGCRAGAFCGAGMRVWALLARWLPRADSSPSQLSPLLPKCSADRDSPSTRTDAV